MRRLQHQVARAVDQLALGLGVAAPEQEHEVLALAVEGVDAGIGESLPALALVRTGLAALDRQHRVQQQYALVCPGQQAAVVGPRQAEVALDLLEDVLERGRYRHARQDREAQPVRLARPMVGILAEDHDLDLLERRGVQRGEDVRSRGIDDLAGALLRAQELTQCLHLRPFELGADARLPRRFQADPVFAHAPACPRCRRDTRSWNCSLVTSRRSSNGLCTRSFAPARSSAAWLAGLSSPVITSTGSSPFG